MRFEREAQAVSSLNHPHMGALYDIGSQDEVDFLVMEYVEGETLAQKLKKGPLPLNQRCQSWLNRSVISNRNGKSRSCRGSHKRLGSFDVNRPNDEINLFLLSRYALWKPRRSASLRATDQFTFNRLRTSCWESSEV